jgi:hypothetical protein
MKIPDAVELTRVDVGPAAAGDRVKLMFKGLKAPDWNFNPTARQASIRGSATFGHPRQLPHAFIGSKIL